jgi:hypothetical protein
VWYDRRPGSGRHSTRSDTLYAWWCSAVGGGGEDRGRVRVRVRTVQRKMLENANLGGRAVAWLLSASTLSCRPSWFGGALEGVADRSRGYRDRGQGCGRHEASPEALTSALASADAADPGRGGHQPPASWWKRGSVGEGATECSKAFSCSVGTRQREGLGRGRNQ